MSEAFRPSVPTWWATWSQPPGCPRLTQYTFLETFSHSVFTVTQLRQDPFLVTGSITTWSCWPPGYYSMLLYSISVYAPAPRQCPNGWTQGGVVTSTGNSPISIIYNCCLIGWDYTSTSTPFASGSGPLCLTSISTETIVPVIALSYNVGVDFQSTALMTTVGPTSAIAQPLVAIYIPQPTASPTPSQPPSTSQPYTTLSSPSKTPQAPPAEVSQPPAIRGTRAGLGVGRLVGICLGVALIFIAGGAYLCLLRRRNKDGPSVTEAGPQIPGPPSTESATPCAAELESSTVVKHNGAETCAELPSSGLVLETETRELAELPGTPAPPPTAAASQESSQDPAVRLFLEDGRPRAGLETSAPTVPDNEAVTANGNMSLETSVREARQVASTETVSPAYFGSSNAHYETYESL